MPIYWSMMAATALFGFLSLSDNKFRYKDNVGNANKTRFSYAFLTFAYIAFFCSLRDVVQDTSLYISSFNSTPNNWSSIPQFISNHETGKLFYIIQAVFKNLISDNHYVWLGFLCIISMACLLRVYYKRSENFPFTAFLFVASTTFTWLINGTRQFLAVCILFAFSDWLLKEKRGRYAFLALVLSYIHNAAIFMIPVCLFISAKKLWDKRLFLFVVLTIFGTVFSENVFDFLNDTLDKDYSAGLAADTGSNILRLVIALVPVIIIAVERKIVEDEADDKIILAANMSVVNACFYLASTFTSGILVGRMPIFFSIYNLYLLPWLIKHCFKWDKYKIITILCIVFYTFYFYYQMHIAWKGLEYVSEILNIHYW